MEHIVRFRMSVRNSDSKDLKGGSIHVTVLSLCYLTTFRNRHSWLILARKTLTICSSWLILYSVFCLWQPPLHFWNRHGTAYRKVEPGCPSPRVHTQAFPNAWFHVTVGLSHASLPLAQQPAAQCSSQEAVPCSASRLPQLAHLTFLAGTPWQSARGFGSHSCHRLSPGGHCLPQREKGRGMQVYAAEDDLQQH